MTVSAAPSMWVSGETIDETIAFGARNLSFVMALVRTSDRDDCGLRISSYRIKVGSSHGASSVPIGTSMDGAGK